jgi:hypothetical protein
MVMSIPRWNRSPSRASVYGSCFHNFLYFLILCSISSGLYKVPCLWFDRLSFVLSHSLCCRGTRVPLNVLSPHPFGSTTKGSTLIDNLIQTLNHFIVLLVNVSQGSITIVYDVLYLVSCSFVLGIFNMVYCIIFGIWNCITSLANSSCPSTTFRLHSTTWLFGLIIFTNVKLLFDLCLLPFYYSPLRKKLP